MAAKAEVKARYPVSEFQDHKTSEHIGPDFPTFLGQIMSSMMAGKRGGQEWDLETGF